METQLITNYISYKGGVNNLKIVSVMTGFLTLAVYTGKWATKSAKAAQKRFNNGKNIYK